MCVLVTASQDKDHSPPPVQVRPRSRPSSPPSTTGTPKAGVRTGSAAARVQQGSPAMWSVLTLAGVLYIGERDAPSPGTTLLSPFVLPAAPALLFTGLFLHACNMYAEA